MSQNQPTLSIRPTPSGFAIDDGTQQLDACPCCDSPLKTHVAVLAIVQAIKDGKFTFETAIAAMQFFRSHQPSP